METRDFSVEQRGAYVMDSNANVSRIAQKYKRYNNDVIAATGLCNMCVTAKRKERRKAEEKGLETRGNT